MKKNHNKYQFNSEVKKVFDKYPSHIWLPMSNLRQLIFEVAEQINQLNDLQETLKWGEPSYICSTGSTIRIDWKEKTPQSYYMFFHCKTKLVDTFKEIYGSLLEFQSNRAIIFDINKPPDKYVLRHCVELALTYHQRKHLPLLGE